MPYANIEDRKRHDKERYQSRLAYWKEYRKKHRRPRNPASKTSVGFEGEDEALKILEGSERYTREIDLIWKGKLIDVKTAIKSQMKESKTYSWKFSLKQKGKVDYFLLILKNLDRTTDRVLLVPDKAINPKSFRIAESRLPLYDKYIISYLT